MTTEKSDNFKKKDPLFGKLTDIPGKVNEGFVNDEPSIVDLTTTNNTNRGINQNQIVAKTEDDRDEWNNPIEFLLSCISMSVGLGNVWRFPFVAYENGGGAFLIPYLIILTLIGRPIYFLELIIGQFTSKGPVKCWELSPMFRGVGYVSVLSAGAITTYYVSIMAHTMFYFLNSFSSTLPWTQCQNYTEAINCQNNTDIASKTSNSELYYMYEVLKKKDSIDDGIGYPDWRMTLCLLGSWLFLVFTLIKGVQSSGKVAYFTAIFPYVVIIILLVRGATLEGAKDGIIYFLEPQWEKLTDFGVWYQAVSQCFFSLGTGMGVIVMFGSYNPFSHNVYRDAMIVSLMDTFTSILAGCTIFSILGNLAHESNSTISEVSKSGAGLAFISYPQAIGLFDWVPQLFAVLFFLMLFTLAIGTAGALTGGVITIICDNYPHLARWKVTIVVCAAGFAIGLIYVTPGGQWMLTLVENYAGTGVIYIMATVEVIGIMWIYGMQNFLNDIQFMLGIKIGWYWIICWGLVTPVLLIFIFFYYTFTAPILTHEDKDFPEIALILGWILYALLLFIVPGVALYNFFQIKSGTILQRIKELSSPSQLWGPRKTKIHEEWKEYKVGARKSLKIWGIIRKKLAFLLGPSKVDTFTTNN